MNLSQQKKQARELLRDVRNGSAGALARIRIHQERWASLDDAAVRHEIALHDAQFVIAREQGFPSWTKLKAYAEPSRETRFTRIFVPDLDWVAERVHGLLSTRQWAGPAALEQIREWHPRFAGCSDEEILAAPFTEADARLVYARQHGFDTWQELAGRVRRVASDPAAEASEPFLAAFRALQSRDASRLKSLLDRHPHLARERGTNGNTLLNLAVALAAKTSRAEAVAPVDALIAAGADVNQANDRGWTPLHQAAYSSQCDIAAMLIRSGAELDAEAHGSGGTPLVTALFWGHDEMADLLARHSVAPGNLRVAAGLGNRDLLEQCFTPEGTLRPEASAARGFYRPHSGFPDWRPSADPQQVLDEALVWACRNGRTEILARLVRAGARLDADPYRGTPLIWAAVRNRRQTVEWLLENGASIDRKGTFGGRNHGQGVTALHMAAQNGHLELVQLLVARGANPAIRDDLWNGDAAGAANHFGHVAVRDFLLSLSTK